MRRAEALQTAWSDLPWLFSLTQNIAVHPTAVEMEERHASIMPQRLERWQALELSHLSACADGSDDNTSWVEEVKMHFSGQVLVAKDLMEF
jgi:hypothetical protein